MCCSKMKGCHNASHMAASHSGHHDAHWRKACFALPLLLFNTLRDNSCYLLPVSKPRPSTHLAVTQPHTKASVPSHTCAPTESGGYSGGQQMLIAVKLPGGNVNPLSVTASCGLGDREDREAKDSRQGGEWGASSCREEVIEEGLTKNPRECIRLPGP